MAVRHAGVISIKLQAGTAEFIRDMQTAGAGVKRFGDNMRTAGRGGVSEMKASAAAVKLMEGNLLSGGRAAEAFLADVVGLGGAFKAAFPIIGGIAFAG